MKKRVLSLLLVFCLLFCWSPIKAEAVMWEIVVVDAVIVFSALVLGIGLFELGASLGDEAVAFGQWTAAAVDALGDFIVDGDKVEIRTAMVDGYQQYYADVAMVESVRQWLVDSGFVQEQDAFSYGNGCALVRYDATDVANFWATVDLYSLAASAALGDVMMISSQFSYLSENSYGFEVVWNAAYNCNVLMLTCYSDLSLLPFTSQVFPVGEFVDLNNVSSRETDLLYSSVVSAYGHYPGMLFLNYDDAFAAYQEGVSLGWPLLYLTPDSRVIPVVSSGSATSYSGVACVSALGRIDGNGMVSTLDMERLYVPFKDLSSRYYFYPATAVQGSEIVVSPGLSSGYIGDLDEDIMTAYPAWVQNAIVNGDTTYVPLGMSGSLGSTNSLSQEQIWGGCAFAESPIISTQNFEYLLSYEVGEIPKPLFAKAYSPDGGTLTYQWYANGLPIAGETTAVFYPRTDALGETEYCCLVGNVTTNEIAASYAWTWPVKVTVTEVGAEIEPTTPVVSPDSVAGTKLETFINAISVPIQNLATTITQGVADIFTNSKSEAIAQGNTAVTDVITMVPDQSVEFVAAFDNLVSVLSYEDTACVITFPGVVVPAVSDQFPETVLLEAQDVDLEKFVQLMPTPIMVIIIALFDCAIVVFCSKEFMGLMSAAVNGFSKVNKELEG